MPHHQSMERLYAVAAELPEPIKGQSAVARWLNESPQTLRNWELRGVSKQGALKAQKLAGCSATWVLTGEGQRGRSLTATPPPTGKEKGAFLKTVTPEEQLLLDHFRDLLPSDREEALKDMAKLAAVRAAQRREILAEAGLDRIAAGAAHASRRMTATSSVDPADPRLKQKPLFGAPDEA